MLNKSKHIGYRNTMSLNNSVTV